MKYLIHAATASALIAAGGSAAQAASNEAVHPVMVLQHDPALPEKLRRSTAACVQLAQAGRFEEAVRFCTLAIRYSEQGSPGASVDTSLEAAAIAPWSAGCLAATSAPRPTWRSRPRNRQAQASSGKTWQ